jgi:hypothetical protein
MTNWSQPVHVFVNGERVTLSSERVPVHRLIELGGGHSGEYELQQRDGSRGRVTHTYQDPHQTITARAGDHFTTRFIGAVQAA